MIDHVGRSLGIMKMLVLLKLIFRLNILDSVDQGWKLV